MKKKMIAFVLCLVCLVSVVSFAGAEEVREDYLAGISGTYVELFPEMAKEEYRQLWLDAAAPLVGEEYAEDVENLMSWFEGSYAYWNAAGIAADYTDEIMADVISLFVTENLSDEEA